MNRHDRRAHARSNRRTRRAQVLGRDVEVADAQEDLQIQFLGYDYVGPEKLGVNGVFEVIREYPNGTTSRMGIIGGARGAEAMQQLPQQQGPSLTSMARSAARDAGAPRRRRSMPQAGCSGRHGIRPALVSRGDPLARPYTRPTPPPSRGAAQARSEHENDPHLTQQNRAQNGGAVTISDEEARRRVERIQTPQREVGRERENEMGREMDM